MVCNVLNMIWTVRDALRHYFPIGYDPQSPHSESIYPSVISLAGQPELIWWALTEGPARRAIQQPRTLDPIAVYGSFHGLPGLRLSYTWRYIRAG